MKRRRPSRTIRYRRLRSREEYREAGPLQCLVWGLEPADALPWSQLLVWDRNGGLVLGAFAGKRLVAISIGHPAWDGRDPYLYSKMLGVAPEWQGLGIGRRLKLLQRRLALGLGYARIRWTFDPLARASALLNIGHLGALAVAYVPDFYGYGGIGGLHHGLSSDRFVVDWWLRSEHVRRRLRRANVPRRPGAGDLPVVLNGASSRGALRAPARGRCLLAALPSNIDRLKAERPSEANAWRAAFRRRVAGRIERGHVIEDVVWIGPRQDDRLFYVLRPGRRGETPRARNARSRR